ncbi:hypothetical protein QBC37DRAFT_398351 [Rhypophila decipiens]|uniref:Uncharacterized protein n=1 Tax=Rhypophila decipiens TaxID=261697 RepID=A0AAN6YFQ3_9PEZI|nr:hypothetical protein QBC37DRAFT_398351 [Rhypophila decipiens]
MRSSLAFVLAPLGGVLAASSLSCQTSAPITVHCCASESSEVVETVLPSNAVMLGCADEISKGRWFRNHAGYYARVSSNVGSCMLTESGAPSNTDALPKCRVETHASNGLMRNGTAFVAAACDAKCVTNSKMKVATKARRTVRTTLRNFGAAYHNSTASGPYARCVNGTAPIVNGTAQSYVNGTRLY